MDYGRGKRRLCPRTHLHGGSLELQLRGAGVYVVDRVHGDAAVVRLVAAVVAKGLYQQCRVVARAVGLERAGAVARRQAVRRKGERLHDGASSGACEVEGADALVADTAGRVAGQLRGADDLRREGEGGSDAAMLLVAAEPAQHAPLQPWRADL